MRIKDLPIKRRLMWMILLTSGVVLLITSAFVMSYQWLTSRETLADNVSTLAEVIARNSTAALAFRNQEDATEILSGLSAEGNINGAVLYDSQDQMFAKYVKSGVTIRFPDKPLKPGQLFTKKRFIVSLPVIEAGQRHGTLHVEASVDFLYESLSRYAQVVLILMIICSLAALLLSNILQRNISAPILSLANTATAVSERRDYSVRAKKFSNDELGRLTETFNNMLTEIQVVDAGLRKALGEKDVLIQEIHHRVKNNLQVILSLIDMQSRAVDNPEATEVFMDCKARIRSMALVHDMLYRTSDFSRIEFSIYADRLANDLLKLYQPSTCTIKSIISLKELHLDINKAVPLGLLMNEIITNSLKHAFRNRSQGTIFLEQVDNGGIVLIARDDGEGLPHEIDFKNPQSFGLRIIQLLVEQLDGTIELDRSSGTTYTIRLSK